MKLNQEILDAIRLAVEHYGNTSQFAKEIGVTHSTVLFWLSGKTSNINNTIWEKRVRRVLRKFMPGATAKTSVLQDPGSAFNLVQNPPVQQTEKELGRKVPAIPLSRMNEFDITMQSAVSFIRQNSSSEVSFANKCSDFSFAFLLDDPVFCPNLPIGTRILVRGTDYADDGDIVVGKTRNPARLFFCRLHRSAEGKTKLEPLNPKLPDISWNTSENAERVFWIFPVNEISINLDTCRWVKNSLIDK